MLAYMALIVDCYQLVHCWSQQGFAQRVGLAFRWPPEHASPGLAPVWPHVRADLICSPPFHSLLAYLSPVQQTHMLNH